MKKKLLSCLLTSFISIALLAGCSNKTDDNVIRIGGIGPLTGAASTYGISVKEGALLLEKEVNNSGGINGKKIQFVFEDDQANPTSAIQLFNRLIDNENVVAVVGATTSGSTLAIAPYSTVRKIPTITPTATEPSITRLGGDYMFRGCFVDSFQGEMLAKYSTETLQKKTAAVLYNSGSDYSKGIADAFKTKFEANGGTVTEFLSYNDKDSDFKAQLTNIKSSNPDILVLPDYYNVVALIAKQARSIGIESQFLGGDGWESDNLAEIGGDSVEGALYLNHYYSEDSEENVQKFVSEYKAEYNKAPDAFAALSYDSAKLLVKAIEKANSTDGQAIKDALASLEMNSVTGNIKFGDDRSAIKSAVIIKIEDSKKVLEGKITD